MPTRMSISRASMRSRISTQAFLRRVLSRFLLVVIIALAIESLVAAFKFVHEDPAHLVGAALLTVAAAALLGAWALFGRNSASSEWRSCGAWHGAAHALFRSAAGCPG